MAAGVAQRVDRLAEQEREEPLSYVSYSSSLSYLQSIGLILLLAAKVGRAYTRRIEPLFEEMVAALPSPETYRLAAETAERLGDSEGARAWRRRATELE